MRRNKCVKKVIREFLSSEYYDDGRLARLLDDARAGNVPYASFTGCLVGHSSMTWACHGRLYPNIYPKEPSPSYAYGLLPSDSIVSPDNYGKRQRILVPMVLAEIRRRNRRAVGTPQETLVLAG